MDNEFTPKILAILENHFNEKAKDVYQASDLLKYISIKTKSVNKGSKARGSFASLYAIYVVVEDYLKQITKKIDYSKYKGAEFANLFKRQRELPFGAKLQNHALNNRMNEEFRKYFPATGLVPIIRDLATNRYWINENFIKVQIGEHDFNIAESIIQIIDEYAKSKKGAFDTFIETCTNLQKADKKKPDDVKTFIKSLLNPNVDARIFEIVAYSVLKYYYYDQKIYWGFEKSKIKEDNLKLFKTGRTNANDGGIDYVMTPLGRFFQVTETLDVRKYFLDIEKIERYPITFVIKAEGSGERLRKDLENNAKRWYGVDEIVKKYMDCIEEIINIPVLLERLDEAIKNGFVKDILTEIITQSKVEFNLEEGVDVKAAVEESEEEFEENDMFPT